MELLLLWMLKIAFRNMYKYSICNYPKAYISQIKITLISMARIRDISIYVLRFPYAIIYIHGCLNTLFCMSVILIGTDSMSLNLSLNLDYTCIRNM